MTAALSDDFTITITFLDSTLYPKFSFIFGQIKRNLKSRVEMDNYRDADLLPYQFEPECGMKTS